MESMIGNRKKKSGEKRERKLKEGKLEKEAKRS